MNASYRHSNNYPSRKSTTVFDTDQLITHDSVLFNSIDSDFELESGDIIATAPMHTISNVLSSIDGKRKTVFSYYNVPEAAIPRVSREWDHLTTLTNAKTTPNNLHHYRCYMDQAPGMTNLSLHIITEQVTATLSYLHDNGLLTFSDKVKMLCDVSETLSYLKTKDFAHKSLNLDSIVVQSDDHGRKTFKLSNWASWSELTLETSEIKAHYAVYSAPELKRLRLKNLNTEVQSKADVYSLSVAFMKLIGFTNEELASFDAQRVKSAHSFLSYNPKDALCKLILEGLSSDPEQRPTMYAFYEKVESILQHKNELEEIDPARFADYLRGEPYIKPKFIETHSIEHNSGSGLTEKYSLPSPVEKYSSASFDRQQAASAEKEENKVFKSARNKGLIKMASILLHIYPIAIVFMIVFVLFKKSEKPWIDSENLIGGLRGIYMGVGYAPIQDVYFTKDNCTEDYQQENLGEYATNNEFKTWRGNKVCVKRYTAFVNSSQQIQNSVSYQKCSSGIWISTSLPCPVTEIQLFNTDQAELVEQQIRDHIREKDKAPITHLRLSISNTPPCLSTTEKPLVYDQDVAGFVPTDCKTFCKYPNASNFDNEPSINVFEEHQPWGKTLVRGNAFAASVRNYNAYLFALPRLELKDTDNCTSYNTTNMLSCIQGSNTDSWRIASPLLWFSLIVVVLVGVLLFRSWIIYRTSTKDLHGRIKFTYLYFGLAAMPFLMSTYLIAKEASALNTCYTKFQPLQQCLIHPSASLPIEQTSIRATHLSELSEYLFIMIGIAVILFFLSLLAFNAIWLPEKADQDTDADGEDFTSNRRKLLQKDRNQEDNYQSRPNQVYLQM